MPDLISELRPFDRPVVKTRDRPDAYEDIRDSDEPAFRDVLEDTAPADPQASTATSDADAPVNVAPAAGGDAESGDVSETTDNRANRTDASSKNSEPSSSASEEAGRQTASSAAGTASPAADDGAALALAAAVNSAINATSTSGTTNTQTANGATPLGKAQTQAQVPLQTAASLQAAAAGAQSSNAPTVSATATSTLALATAAPLATAESLRQPVADTRIDLAGKSKALGLVNGTPAQPNQSSAVPSAQIAGAANATSVLNSMTASAGTPSPDVLLNPQANVQQTAAQPLQMLAADPGVASGQMTPDLTPTTAASTTPTQPISAPQGQTSPVPFAQQMAQATAQPPAQQLGVFIARGIREGLDRIEIQLHPAELGRVDVRLELGHDGRVQAVVSAERTETLDSLRRDINQLEKALADAGFDTDSDSFTFAERDDNRPSGGEGRVPINADSGSSDGLPDAATAARSLNLERLGVDISV